MKKSKALVIKWIKSYSDVKNGDDRINRGYAQMILQLFEKNSRLSLRGGTTLFRTEGVIVSCDTIRKRFLAHDVKILKNSCLGNRKFRSLVEQSDFF